MRGVKWEEDKDQAIIRPTLRTVAAPAIAVGVFGIGVVLLSYKAITDSESPLLIYLVLNALGFAGCILWLLVSLLPITINREERILRHGDTPTSLADATGVSLQRISNSDAKAFRVEVLFSTKSSAWIGRKGWVKEADPELAEVVARRLARFLDLSLFIDGVEMETEVDDDPLSTVKD